MQRKPKKIKIIIDRSKWRTGRHSKYMTGRGITQLLNNEGYKCCLGFISLQATKQKCRGAYNPEDLNRIVPELSYRDDFCGLTDTQLASDAIVINDDDNTTPQEKERLLKELFKNSRYQLVFRGKFDVDH